MKELLALVAVILLFFVIGLLMTYFGDGLEYKTAIVKINGNEFIVEVAETPQQQSIGLSGRSGLAEDRGMLFVFNRAATPSFWMRGMRFPLDLIWIRGNEVIGTENNLLPDTGSAPKLYPAPEPVDKVLEINGGLVEKLGIRPGDKVSILYNK